MSEKVVWITGASTGIGFETAKAFAKGDYIVVATARRKSRLVNLVKELKFIGCKAFAFVCNVQSERSIISTKKKIIENCGTIDIMVNNAGITVFKTLMETKSYEFDSIMDTNLRGSFLMMKAVLPLMMKKRRGHIINVLSVAAKTVFEESSVYSASKAGLLALANSLRAEVRKFNIRIRARFRNRMLSPAEVAKIIVQATDQPKKVVVEDVIIRPIKGDL